MDKQHAVVDTTAIISYFDSIFEKPSQISRRGLDFLHEAFRSESDILLSIPSIVFVEIFDKWVVSDEFRAMFVAEVLEMVSQAPNIEIKPIDAEVLEKFLCLGRATRLDNHDKLILASAMMLEWPLITSDRNIIKYVKRHKVLPSIIQ
jgi:predicted nucleic acid-binding protein